MHIKCIPVGHLMTNCYIVADEETLGCAVIDPGDESNTILYQSQTHLVKLLYTALAVKNRHYLCPTVL